MRRYLPAVVVFFSVMALSVSGFLISLNNFHNSVQSAFDESTNTTIRSLQRSLKEKLLLLESMHSLYAIFDGVPQPQFRRFVQPFEQELAGLQALQWTVPVRETQRAAFEAARQAEGIPDYRIMERDSSGAMVSASTRELHFPIYPLLPLDEGESSIGFDLASDPVRYGALEKAIASGEVSASSGISLVQGEGERWGFLAFKALYRNNVLPLAAEDRLPQLTGLVLGVFHLSAIFNEVLASLPETQISYTITDLSAGSEPGLLFESPISPATSQAASPGWNPLPHTLNIQVADRTWEIRAVPTAAFMAGHQAGSAWLILGVGFLLSVILTFYLVEQTRSAEKIKAAEQERQSLENQLFRSQKMDAIGRLVGGIAHDFNNLLTSIMGYAELALFQRDEEKTQEYLQHVMQGGERGKALIRKLLSFSRNEPAQNSPQFLPPLIEGTLSMLKPVMPSRIILKFEAERALPQVNIDPTSLDQIIVNLCINARDAIPENGTISLSLKHRHVQNEQCLSCQAEIKGDFVILAVEDSGSGIPADAMQRIFKPFYTTKSADRGMGLGLSIINNITHGCQGHILVSSQPGNGTQFKLLLPVTDPSAKPALRQVV